MREMTVKERGEKKARFLANLPALVAVAAAVALFFAPLLFLKKVPDISDIRTYYYPGWAYFGKLLRAGGMEYWCPHLYCGFPLFADSELGPFYPLNRLLWLLPPLGGLVASLFLHYLMAALFTYAYGRYMGLTPLSALVSSLSFSLGGAMVSHLVHPNMIWAAAYLPLFLLLLEMGLRRRSAYPFILMSLVLGLQYLAGFLMIPLMEALAVPIYLLVYTWKEIENGQRIRVLAWSAGFSLAAFLLGTALGMAQNLPSYHLVKESYRAGGLDQNLADVGSLPPLQLLGLVFPRAFGTGIAQGGYTGAWTFEETYCYLGIVPIVMLPFALRRPRQRFAVLFSAMGLFFLLLSLGNEGLLWQVVRHLPGFHVLKGSSRFVLMAGFSLSMLGGLGLQRFTEVGDSFPKWPRAWREREKAWNAKVLATVLLGATAIALLQFNPLRFRDFLAPIVDLLKGGISAPPDRLVLGLSRYFSLGRPEFLLPFAAVSLAPVMRRFLLLHPKRGRRFRLVLAIAAAADVLAFSSMIFPFPPRSAVERVPAVVDHLSGSSGGRTALLTETGVPTGEYKLAPNRLLPNGISYTSGFSTIPPRRMDRFLAMAREHRGDSAYRLLGVEHLLSELVYVRGTAFDLSLDLEVGGWFTIETLTLPSPDPRRICLLLHGDLFARSKGGQWYFVLQPSLGDALRVSLKKAPGEDLPEIVGEDPAGCASVQEVTFRSPGYGKGRRGLFLEIDLGGSKTGDRLGIIAFGSPSPPVVRVLGVSEITATGRSFPVLPYELSYIDSRHAVFRPSGKPERVRALGKVKWVDNWEEASREALNEGEGDVAWLVEGEVDSANLNVMERIRGGGQDVHLRMEDSSSRWDVSATSPEPFVLAISQNFMKGWKAYIDGNEVSPFSVNGVLTGVAVPEGGHRVILEYEPPGLKAGTLISLVALLFLSSLTCLVYIYSRRNGKRDGERP